MTWIPLIVMLALLLMNMIVGVAISVAALAFFFLQGALPSELFVQRLVAATHSFPLLAIPFFIFAGVIMNRTNITQRLMQFVDVFVGHRVGGLAKVNILLSTLMGGMVGSANADAAMQSKILVPEMRRAGYAGDYATAVTATSSIISAIIPPSIGLILYGYLADASIGRLFLAGLVPGFLICIALIWIAGYIAKQRGFQTSRYHPPSVAEKWQAARSSFWVLLLPVLIIAGIRSGFFTPTEAGSAAATYALILGFCDRSVCWKDIPSMIEETVLSTAVVMFIICAATALGFYMSWEQIPTRVATALLSITENPTQLLLIINALLLVTGLFLEGSSGLILLTPILAPVVVELGVDPVHFGIVMVLNLTIGGVTPPMGTLMFVSCAITGVSIRAFSRAVAPFLAVMIALLLLLTLVPQISMTLPNLFY